ncbi:rod shape-determining protein RodA [Sphingomonas melonis]|jgi:rod shape determining protein RodA|uniref:Peptidoglycan glycosyltransferase MrdB n=1 Tax=Sphingomonas melonis TaxID=152682 RepID=A0A7Y9K1V1_9SPHN|nr:rod shape-determining protein RodA [Sphingomonas melonis]NYD90306.1 rod shape determining protein RodA [Sphingomonas melonis]
MTRSRIVPEPIARQPWRVIALVVAIGAFGQVVLYSAAGGSVHPWALSQGIRFFVLLGAALAISYVPERIWKSSALPAYVVIVIALVLVELVGAVRGGSQRWLDVGIKLQPSEFMKPAIVLACARFYDMLPPNETRRFGAIWPAALLIGIPAALIAKQPDLGTALMVCGGGVVVMFLAGVPMRLFIGGALALAIAAPLAFNYVLHDYQRNRVLIFLDPESDPLRTGYHISQSKIAIGSGGIWGKGFLNGTQSHLDYLPEGHTDFVFATMAEEWGLVGGCLLILAFILVVRWGVNVGQQATSRFSRLTAAGLATTIFFYVAINLAMVMGLAPVVGIPLPLVSFGSSAQMTVLLCIGILMSIDRQNRRALRW